MGTLDKTPASLKDLQVKQKDCDDTDTYPLTGWAPAGTKRVMLHNVIIFANNKKANSTLQLKIEMLRKGTWAEVAVAGCRDQETDSMVVDYKGLVKCNELRIRKIGTSDNFNGTAIMTGEVID